MIDSSQLWYGNLAGVCRTHLSGTVKVDPWQGWGISETGLVRFDHGESWGRSMSLPIPVEPWHAGCLNPSLFGTDDHLF